MSNFKSWLTRIVYTLLIGLVSVYGYVYINTERPSKSVQVVVSSPAQVNPGDLVKFNVKVINQPYWLSKAHLHTVVTRDGSVVTPEQFGDTYVIGAGVSSGKINVSVNGVLLYSYFVKYDLEDIPPVSQDILVGTATPAPSPTPPPAPVVLSGNGWLLTVFDNTQLVNLPADQLALKNSVTLQDSLTPLNIKWRNYDLASPIVQSVEYQNFLKQYGAPFYVVADATGKVFSSGKLPANESDVVSLIKKLEGK